MSNLITWNPNSDADIYSYRVEYSSTVAGPYSTLVTILHVVPGADYNSTTGKFFYNDTAHASTTWYRLVSIDSLSQESQPSVPFSVAASAPQFRPGATPFGVFDEDVEFQLEADRLVDFTLKKLGDPIMEVHMSASQIYASFEEAALEFSAIMNTYQARSSLTSFLGSATGSLSGSEQKYITQNLEFSKKLAEPYGDSGPIAVNSTLPVYSGSITLEAGKQKYNMNALMASVLTGSDQRMHIKDIFHFSPLSAYRSFGTTSAVNYLNSQFNFESFTPETIFYLLPIWEDILRNMQFETSNRVRRSNYSYEIHNNELTLYPTPTNNLPLYFTYVFPPDATRPASLNGMSGSAAIDKSYYGVSNLSNVPFGNIQYSNLNSISKHWIRKMAFALAKEIEGQIRSKMATIPIPNGDLTLNGPELIVDARGEQERLRLEIKEILEEMTYDKLALKQAEMTEAINRTIKEIPLPIYIGNFWLLLIPSYYILHELNDKMLGMWI